MFENQISSPSQNSDPAVAPLMATEQMVTPVAKLWCRSFGIADEAAVSRLAKLLSAKVEDELASGVSLGRIQSHFDEAAAEIIRAWFSYLLGREVPAEGKALAILRLAFLDANYDGRWSTSFLNRDFCVQELSSELEAMTIEPVPAASPRPMLRQVF